MFCSKCGKEIPSGAAFCPDCGNSVQPQATTQAQAPAQTTHQVPKCTCCGHVGETVPGPLFRKEDIIWIVLLLILAGAGFIYLLYILIVRGNPKNREQICPNCKSVNMYTYVY